MMAEINLTRNYLKEALHYCPESGIFTWRKRPRRHFTTASAWKKTNTEFSGKTAGFRNKKNYTIIRICGKGYAAHRLAWLYVHGHWPDQIDHINHERSDNRISNLRNVDGTQNSRNHKRRNNFSGVMGVYYRKDIDKWQAYIMVNYRNKYLGTFTDKGDAIAARKAGEIKYGFHPNHGC